MDKKSLVEPGCLGMTEVMKFVQNATKETIEKFDQFVDLNKMKEAIALVENHLKIPKGQLWQCMHPEKGKDIDISEGEWKESSRVAKSFIRSI